MIMRGIRDCKLCAGVEECGLFERFDNRQSPSEYIHRVVLDEYVNSDIQGGDLNVNSRFMVLK